jgi:hypothetical protein
MLLVHGTQADWRSFGTWRPADIEAHIAFANQLGRQLRASGELVSDGGLTGPALARVVRARDGGAPTVDCAPFPEDKQFLSGYWVVDCDGPRRAIEIAAQLSASPGRGGVPLNLAVEVRPVMSAPGEEM